MKQLTTIIIGLVLSFQVTGQESAYELRQIEGSAPHLRRLIGPGIQYAFVMYPMACPRCEGIINPLIDLLTVEDEVRVALLVEYPAIKALDDYLDRRGFHVDTVVSVDDTRSELFSVNTGSLNAPFLIKINEKGQLLFSVPLLGIEVDSVLLDSIQTAKMPLQPVKLVGTTIQDHQSEKVPDRVLALKQDEQHPLSRVMSSTLSEDGSHLLVNDHLTLSTFVYSSGSGEFKGKIQPSDQEERLFISEDIPEEIYAYVKESNILNAMYFKASMVDSVILVVASLPKLLIEGDGLAYYNEVAVVRKELGNDSVHVVSFESLPDSQFVLEHTKTMFDLSNGRLFVPVSKGWPVVAGGQTLDTTVRGSDPFVSTFYNQAPLVAEYDTRGAFKGYLGLVDRRMRAMRTGYSFAAPVVLAQNDIIWAGSGYAGTIYAHRKGEVVDSIVFFDLPEQPLEGRPTDPLAYLRGLNSILYKKIVAIHVSGSEMRGLIRNNSTYTVVSIDMRTGNMGKSAIPSMHSGDKANEPFFMDGGQVAVIYGSGRNARLAVYNSR